MLSVKSSNSPEYLLSQVVADYFLQGGEPPGYFLGGAMDAFDLPEIATRELVEQFFAGFGPDGAKLVKNAGISLAESERGRRPAWDLVFSAPKSVSVLWAMLPDTPGGRRHRRIIEQCQREAVAFGMGYMEDEAGKTRRGKNGTRIEPVKLLSVVFGHGSSRSNECQLHDHVYTFNVGLRTDGFGAIHSHFIYTHKMAAGAAYRNKLANLLQERLGLTIKHDGRSFRIAGVPQAACDANSTRRKQVVARLKKLGLWSSKAAQFATLETRPEKTHISRSELFSKTREMGANVGFKPADAIALIKDGKRLKPRVSEKQLREAVKCAIEFLVKSEAFFSKHQVTRLVMEEMQGSGIDPQKIIAAVNQKLQRGRDVVHLHEYDGIRQYTTTEILQLEGKMLSGVEKLNESSSHGVRKELIDKARAEHPTLSEEQSKAVEHLLSPGQFKVLTGLAGTGKSFVLGICANKWREEGFHVMAACLAGRAALNLQEEAKIRSDTVARLSSAIF